MTARPVRVLALAKGMGVGGVEQLLLWQTMLSDHSRVSIEVAYLLPWKDALIPKLHAAGIVTHCLEAPKEGDLRWAVRLRRLLVAREYDVIHVHSPYVAAIARIVVRTLSRDHRPAVVSTEHNAWRRFSLPTRVANAAVFRLGDAWFTVSEDTRRSIPGFLRKDVEVLVHGVFSAHAIDAIEARGERAAARTEFGLDDGDVAVMTIANLRKEKCHSDLLVAARQVADIDEHVRFFAVGQGQLEKQLKEQHAALGLGDRFRFLGYRADAVRLLAASDIFALASRYEGYPIALMEALAVGLPVVATRVGGITDAVRDGIEGLLVDTGNPHELADAILRLAKDPHQRARMSEAAVERGRIFDMSNAVSRLDETYVALRPS